MEVTAGCTQRTVSCSLLLFQLTQLPPVPDCVLAMELPPATNHVSRAPPAQGASTMLSSPAAGWEMHSPLAAWDTVLLALMVKRWLASLALQVASVTTAQAGERED